MIGEPLGATLASSTQVGVVYVVPTTTGTFPNQPLHSPFAYGNAANERFGHAVGSVGDLGDPGALPEVLVGAPEASGGNGRVAVIAGENVASVSQFNFQNFVRLHDLAAPAGGRFGHQVASPGDMDGDLVDDILVAAPGEDHLGVTDAGRIGLFREDSGTLQEVLSPDPGLHGAASLQGFGTNLVVLSDPDGDGSRDLLVGSDLTVDPSNVPTAHRAFHSYPYRVAINASTTGKSFAKVHGVNGVPVNDLRWRHFGHPFQERSLATVFSSLEIPHSRLHLEQMADDLNYLWKLPTVAVPGVIPDIRTYAVTQHQIDDPGNYSLDFLKDALSAIDALPDTTAVFRIGHGATVIDPIPLSANSPPDDDAGFGGVVEHIVDEIVYGTWLNGGGTDLALVELWNEPEFKNFWLEDPILGAPDHKAYARLYKELDAALDAGLPSGWRNDIQVSLATAASDRRLPDWTTGMLAELDNIAPTVPVENIVCHSYGTYPRAIVKKAEKPGHDLLQGRGDRLCQQYGVGAESLDHRVEPQLRHAERRRLSGSPALGAIHRQHLLLPGCLRQRDLQALGRRSLRAAAGRRELLRRGSVLGERREHDQHLPQPRRSRL